MQFWVDPSNSAGALSGTATLLDFRPSTSDDSPMQLWVDPPNTAGALGGTATVFDACLVSKDLRSFSMPYVFSSFEPIRTHSDPFGPIRTHSYASVPIRAHTYLFVPVVNTTNVRICSCFVSSQVAATLAFVRVRSATMLYCRQFRFGGVKMLYRDQF